MYQMKSYDIAVNMSPVWVKVLQLRRGVRAQGPTGSAGVGSVSPIRRSESEWTEFDVYDAENAAVGA